MVTDGQERATQRATQPDTLQDTLFSPERHPRHPLFEISATRVARIAPTSCAQPTPLTPERVSRVSGVSGSNKRSTREGPFEMADDILAEMRQRYLNRKPSDNWTLVPTGQIERLIEAAVERGRDLELRLSRDLGWRLVFRCQPGGDSEQILYAWEATVDPDVPAGQIRLG